MKLTTKQKNLLERLLRNEFDRIYIDIEWDASEKQNEIIQLSEKLNLSITEQMKADNEL